MIPLLPGLTGALQLKSIAEEPSAVAVSERGGPGGVPVDVVAFTADVQSPKPTGVPRPDLVVAGRARGETRVLVLGQGRG